MKVGGPLTFQGLGNSQQKVGLGSASLATTVAAKQRQLPPHEIKSGHDSWVVGVESFGVPSTSRRGLRGSIEAVTDPQQAAAGVQAAERLHGLLTLFAPNATNVRIKHVHDSPHEIRIVDYRADLPDGSSVYAPHITIQLV